MIFAGGMAIALASIVTSILAWHMSITESLLIFTCNAHAGSRYALLKTPMQHLDTICL